MKHIKEWNIIYDNHFEWLVCRSIYSPFNEYLYSRYCGKSRADVLYYAKDYENVGISNQLIAQYFFPEDAL